MAFIECPECEKRFSDKAEACPECAYPMDNNNTARDGAIENYRSRFDRKFRIVYREIEIIRSKIYEKRGWLFFKSHVYTKDELLKSEHFSLIDSTTRKIGDDIRQWEITGRLSPEEKEAYESKRDEVEYRLHSMNMEIQSRKPTFWENIKGTLEDFTEWVMNNLPELHGFIMIIGRNVSKIPYVGPGLSRALAFADKQLLFLIELKKSKERAQRMLKSFRLDPVKEEQYSGIEDDLS